MQEDFPTIKALMIARAYLYELFHKALGGKPTQCLVDAIASTECADAIDEYARPGNGMEEFAVFIGSIDTADPSFLECAVDEYNCLLIGMGAPQLPLWESPYVSDDGSLFSERVLDVRAWYRNNGLRARHQGSVPEDHLSLMMAFLARSARNAYDALKAGRLDDVASRLKQDGCFIDMHINNWSSVLLEQMERKEGSFYLPVIRGSVAFAQIDRTFMEQACQWTKQAASEPFEDIVDDGFARMEDAVSSLKELKLPFLEENELICVS